MAVDPATGKYSMEKFTAVFVGFVPAVTLAHQLVKEGRLGRIYHVRAFYLQDWAGPDVPLIWRFDKKVAGSGSSQLVSPLIPGSALSFDRNVARSSSGRA